MKQFEEDLKVAFQIGDLIKNTRYCVLIDFTDDYYNMLCNLINYAETNVIGNEVKEQLKDLKELVINIHRGQRGDFDDLGDM
ncbi:hypothetical protein U6M79_12275 [Cutibacterium acnes]